MKSMWIIAEKYLGILQNDLKNLENILLLILLKVNQIVHLESNKGYSIPKVSGQVKKIPYFLREQDVLNLYCQVTRMTGMIEIFDVSQPF